MIWGQKMNKVIKYKIWTSEYCEWVLGTHRDIRGKIELDESTCVAKHSNRKIASVRFTLNFILMHISLAINIHFCVRYWEIRNWTRAIVCSISRFSLVIILIIIIIMNLARRICNARSFIDSCESSYYTYSISIYTYVGASLKSHHSLSHKQ